MPEFKKDNSRKRVANISYLYSIMVKMLSSGLKTMVVPVESESPMICTSCRGFPQENSCIYILPFLRTSARRYVESAFTQETPTPCKPPDTLYVPLSNLPPACN